MVARNHRGRLLYFTFFDGRFGENMSLRWSANPNTWRAEKFISLEGWLGGILFAERYNAENGYMNRSFYINNMAMLM